MGAEFLNLPDEIIKIQLQRVQKMPQNLVYNYFKVPVVPLLFRLHENTFLTLVSYYL